MKKFPSLSAPARLTALIPLLFSAVAAQTAPEPSAAIDTTQAAPASDETVQLPAFDVNSTRDVGYGARDAMGATRIDTDLDKTPTSVVVLDQQFLQDTAELDATQVLQYVSGINRASGEGTGQVSIRGFNQGGVTYRDGLPQATNANGTQFLDMADVERIEIVKGPEGVLYGSVTGGGVINAVSKQPLEQQMTDLNFYAGSYNVYGATLDNTGPVNQSGSILYRIVANEQEGYTQVYGADNDRTLIEPTITFKLGNASDFQIRFAYARYEENIAVAPWFADEIGGQLSTFLSPRDNFDEPDEVTKQLQYLTTLTFNHRFGDNWNLRVVYRENQIDEGVVAYNKTGFTFLNAAGQTVGTIGTASSTIPFLNPNWVDILANRTRKYQDLYTYNQGAYVDLAGKEQIGPVSNTALFSAGYQDTIVNSFQATGTYPSTSVFNPVHYSNPLTVAGPELPTTNSETATPDAFISAMDNIGIFHDRLIFTLGARRDTVDNYSTNRLTSPNTYTVLKTDGRQGASYKVGVVYRPINGLSFFYDHASTFTAEAGSLYTGAPYVPEVGGSQEGGTKVELFNGKLTGTLSYFDIVLDNVPERIVIDSLGDLGNTQAGWVRAKGTELDLAAEPLPGVTMLVAYGNLDSLTNAGVPQRNVPVGGNYKTLIKYAFPHSTWLHGFAVGAGYIYTPRRAGDTSGTFFLPPAGEYNAFAYYELGRHWRYQINGDNLANNPVAGVSSVNNVNIYPGTPRTILTSINYRF